MRKPVKGLAVIIVVLIVFVGLMLATACQRSNEKAAEKMIEKALQKAGGGKADIDLKNGKISVKTDQGSSEFSAGGGEWPGDLPGDIPKIENGKIKGVFRGSDGERKSWTIALDGVDNQAYGKYIDELKAKGWEIIMNMTLEEGASAQIKKDKTMIILTFNKSQKSMGLSINTGIE